MRRTRSLVACGALAAAVLAAAGCSDGPVRGQDAFCRQLQAERAVIDTPAGSTAAANAQVERFRALDRIAPEAIRDEWHAVTELMALASSTDVATVDGRTALAQAAVAASRPAEAVRTYVRDVCGIDLTGTVVVTPPPTSAASADPGAGSAPPSSSP